MHRFNSMQHATPTAVPDAGVKASEYELAEQDVAQRTLGHVAPAPERAARPDTRSVRGNPPSEADEITRREQQLDRVIGK